MADPLKAVEIVADIGAGGVALLILVKWVIPKLDKLNDKIAEMGTVITLLITSLPDIKQRAKEEAKRLHEKFKDDTKE